MSTQITQQNSHEREPAKSSPEVRALKNLRLAETDRARVNLFAVPVKPLERLAKKLDAVISKAAKPQKAEQAPVAEALDLGTIRHQVTAAETAAPDQPIERAADATASNVTALPSHRELTAMQAEARAAIERAFSEAA